MNLPRLLIALLALALLPPGCSTPPPSANFPDIGFGHLSPLVLDVAKIEVVGRYQSTLSPPNIEHLARQSPEKVLRVWARQRLQAGGVAGVARLIIQDAAIVSNKLSKTKGLKGFSTVDQAQRLVLSIKARLEIETAGGLGRGYADAQVTRSTTVPENISLNDYDATLFELVERAAADFDVEMVKSIKIHLAPFLK
jgi:hypothetical protein